VLDVGPIDQIDAGDFATTVVGPNDKLVKQVKSMADPDLTNPSIRFVPHSKGIVDG